MGQCGDFIMSEGWDAMAGHRPRHLMRPFRVLEGLPRMLLCTKVFLFSPLFAGAVGVGRLIVQLGGALMVFIMRTVVMARGHMGYESLAGHNLPGFGVRFHSQLIGTIRICQGALRMPVTRLGVALFVMFGGGPMGVGREFMLFGGSTMGFVHGGFSSGVKIARQMSGDGGLAIVGPACARSHESENYHYWR